MNGAQHNNMTRKPEGYRPVLQTDNAKTSKGTKYGYLTGIMYLAPANESGRINLCPMATDGCKAGCLFTAGLASVHASINRARLAKTHFMLDNPEAFIASLRYDIAALARKADKLGLKPAVRINGTSDVPKIAMQLASEFPNVQFYDYTKLPKAWMRTAANYHLTFSHSENNEAECISALQHGVNVAVVFDTRKGQTLPESWNGYSVIDGDQSDLRFLDPAGVIVGLRAKGKAKHDVAGFVVPVNQLVSIGVSA